MKFLSNFICFILFSQFQRGHLSKITKKFKKKTVNRQSSYETIYSNFHKTKKFQRISTITFANWQTCSPCQKTHVSHTNLKPHSIASPALQNTKTTKNKKNYATNEWARKTSERPLQRDEEWLKLRKHQRFSLIGWPPPSTKWGKNIYCTI